MFSGHPKADLCTHGTIAARSSASSTPSLSSWQHHHQDAPSLFLEWGDPQTPQFPPPLTSEGPPSALFLTDFLTFRFLFAACCNKCPETGFQCLNTLRVLVFVWGPVEGVLWVIHPPFSLPSADGRTRPSRQLLSPVSPSSALSPSAFLGGQGIPGTSPAPRQGLTFTDEIFPLSPPLSSFPFSSRKAKLLTQSLGRGNATPAATALESWVQAVPPRELPEKSRPGWHRVWHTQRGLDLLLTIIIMQCHGLAVCPWSHRWFPAFPRADDAVGRPWVKAGARWRDGAGGCWPHTVLLARLGAAEVSHGFSLTVSRISLIARGNNRMKNSLPSKH